MHGFEIIQNKDSMHCTWDLSSTFLNSIPLQVNQLFIYGGNFIIEEENKQIFLHTGNIIIMELLVHFIQVHLILS